MVSIGILTYRRADGLRACLASVQRCLGTALPAPWAGDEILVVDNDPAGSARDVIVGISEATSPLPVRYVHEPTPGIAAARTRALSETKSQVMVFIDDDEVAEDGWPHGLLTLMSETGAALVGGPVLSEFVDSPPAWIIDGGFFDRKDPPHGSSQDWLRSGNLAIDVQQVKAAGITFDQRFKQGEDSAFSRRAKAGGLDLRWSAHGAITEFVDRSRFDVGWRLRREFLSHRAWARSRLDLSDGPFGRTKTRVQILAGAGARTATGMNHLVQAVFKRSKVEAVMGAIDFVGVGAKLVETVAYRRAGS